MHRRYPGAVAIALAASSPAMAGVEVGTLSPRAIGHAGAALVSDDGAAAPYLCPAAIARRDQRRAQLAGIVLDDEATLLTPDHPRVVDGSGASAAPLVGAQGQLGPLVLAVSFARDGAFDRTLPIPPPELPAIDVVARYPHRYAGHTARLTRRTLAAAGALRVNDWLAIGAAVTLGQVDIDERRTLWAGFAGRDPLAQPTRDVDVTLSASDGLVPGGALGALLAPLDTPLELAVGVAWTDDVRADGAAGFAPRNAVPIVAASAPRAALRFGGALTTGLGVRWLGERYAIEGAATWVGYPTGVDRWAIAGVELVDQSGARAALTALPTRLPHRAHGSLAAAVDVEAIPGFAWVSAGYRWASAAAPAVTTSTVGADLGGHTLAIGVELAVEGATITIGVAHQLARTVTVAPPGLPLDNPFRGGVAPADLGRHQTSLDVIGVGLELSAP